MQYGQSVYAYEEEMTTRQERIQQTLTEIFKPESLEVIDESGKHARHAGRQGLPAGETHYRVAMIAGSLAGQSRVARQRAVHEALGAEFKSGLHALSLSLRTPDEAG
jgi:stress-induced morphogen